MFKTRITELLGCQYPIIGGPMAHLSKAELVAAISNAGAFGIIAAASFESKEELIKEIRRTKELTDKPFSVNIALLARDPGLIESHLDAVIEEGLPVVETAARTPAPYIERLKKENIKVIHKCATVRHAQAAERIGVDAVTIVGFECGGHPSQEDVTTFVMIPLAADVLKIPLIAGGGIGDARGFVAAMALGADGVVIGTRLMATQECSLHPRVKQWLVESKETDTVLVERSIQRNMRARRNAATDKILELEARGASLEDLLPLVSGQRSKRVFETGDLDAGTVACGQVVGLVREVVTVRELIEGIVKGSEGVMARLQRE